MRGTRIDAVVRSYKVLKFVSNLAFRTGYKIGMRTRKK